MNLDLNWCEDHPDKPGYWVTTEPLVAELGREGGLSFTVPRGFSFNFSGPWFKHVLFRTKSPKYRRACALHDYALKTGFSRTYAAAVFSSALRQDGVGKWRRLFMVLGVIVWNWI